MIDIGRKAGFFSLIRFPAAIVKKRENTGCLIRALR